jgi:SAM-dependent methyltransferase
MLIIILICINILTILLLIIVSLYYEIPKKLILKYFNKDIIEPKYSIYNFLKKINKSGKLLDVGCGNNSPYIYKTMFPEIHYTGIDVGDYNQIKPNLADEYLVVQPEEFSNTIQNLSNNFDTVISSHNLEHCNDRKKTLVAITNVLKTDGLLYLSFPSERSVKFKYKRKGCLNYYDDKTHKDSPPNFRQVIKILKENNMEILFKSKSYKPFFMFLIGFFSEWKSRRLKEKQLGTWGYYGFEAKIWAIKKLF